MEFQYFEKTDMLYIKLADGISVESEEVASGIVIDYNAQDQIVGIEIEDARKSLDLSRLEILNLPLTKLVVSDATQFGTSIKQPASRTRMIAEPRASYQTAET